MRGQRSEDRPAIEAGQRDMDLPALQLRANWRQPFPLLEARSGDQRRDAVAGRLPDDDLVDGCNVERAPAGRAKFAAGPLRQLPPDPVDSSGQRLLIRAE